ncbi:uncharacterized protein LOC134261092 [Saccostrea cucullata]|uniref:uncharacterized protein LOC134261092 n=1 Tax=Saccostrea cuccullata TaxID=36930 RepID=UPI002ED01C50
MENVEITVDDKYDITKQFSSQLQIDEIWYTLLVTNVQAEDFTKYYCVGTNRYEDGETTIILFETMNPPEGSICLNDTVLGEYTVSETNSSTAGLAETTTGILEETTDSTTKILEVEIKSNVKVPSYLLV